MDAEKVALEKVSTVQIRTGGACHLDAPMIEMGLKQLDLDNLDIVIIENVGNLVCPAEFETGAALKVMLLSTHSHFHGLMPGRVQALIHGATG